ncbi:MAG: thiamine pyrophosphate-binding protein [Flavobacteriaceae bacterium]
MAPIPRPRTGGQILVDQLIAQGVTRAACVPGESYLAVLDALHDASIDLIVCRQEAGATIMAEAEGKLTGRPGIAFVTRGPGATNGSHGVHIAMQDSTPLIMFVGQVERGTRGREAFQEIDYPAMFGSIAKWAFQIDEAARIPELVARAFRIAMQGRPGPVVIALPEDMLRETASVADAPYVVAAESAPRAEDMEQVAALLSQARSPIAIVGGSRWSGAGIAAMEQAAVRHGIPVATSFRRSHLFNAAHSHYAGDLGIGPNPRLAERVRGADLVLLIGGRLSEMPSSSYSMLDIPSPRQTLVHVHPSAEELGRVYQPALAINCPPSAFAVALAALDGGGDCDAASRAHEEYIAWSETPLKVPGAFQYGDVMVWLRERLSADAIIANGAGNYAGWIHRYYRFRRFGTQLAPTSGSMGYGVPAAIMAKRMYPEREVVCFAGDGCFLMNGQEFATAVQYGTAVIFIVIDNGMYGTIRMHQERDYPGRVSGTALRNPDFAAYATAFGGHGERIERTEDFAPAFERAAATGLPAILHCMLDPEAITPARTLTQIRENC